nr:DNA-3-methyladenine glycosylase [Sinobaca sp. H24]
MKRLNKEFFHLPTLELSRALLGQTLVKETPEGKTAGRIVETEAYIGPEDRAAHSYKARRTKRTEIMFASPGHVYTYSMHTHCLFNIVSAPENSPEAILIRAVEPLAGKDLMESRRSGRRELEWTNGPGKLTKALGISMDDYGRHCCDDTSVYLLEGRRPEHIQAGPRVGIDNSGEAVDYPWRFWDSSSPYVSKSRKKPGTP